MDSTHVVIDRPDRSESVFNAEFTVTDVERVMQREPFKNMDAENFPKRLPPREIIRHDSRLRRYRKGEIIVRAGDYGTSAFFILSGIIRVILHPDLPPAVLGRREPARKNFFQSLSQLWTNARDPEVLHKQSQSKLNPLVKNFIGGVGDLNESGVFLQDIPRILSEHKSAAMEAGIGPVTTNASPKPER
jgi:hypothetical protein